jgi:hypothetical protein
MLKMSMTDTLKNRHELEDREFNGLSQLSPPVEKDLMSFNKTRIKKFMKKSHLNFHLEVITGNLLDEPESLKVKNLLRQAMPSSNSRKCSHSRAQ